MRFQLDDDDSDNDSLEAISPGSDGNTKSRELLSHEIPPRIQILQQSDENSPLNIPTVYGVDKKLSNEMSCNATFKTHASAKGNKLSDESSRRATIKSHASDMDSIADVIEGVDLSRDLGLDELDPNDAKDNETAVTPIMSNRTLGNAEASKLKDRRKFRRPRRGGIDGNEYRGPRNDGTPKKKKRHHSDVGKEKIGSLPNHLKSLMVAFSHMQRNRSEKIQLGD